MSPFQLFFLVILIALLLLVGVLLLLAGRNAGTARRRNWQRNRQRNQRPERQPKGTQSKRHYGPNVRETEHYQPEDSGLEHSEPEHSGLEHSEPEHSKTDQSSSAHVDRLGAGFSNRPSGVSWISPDGLLKPHSESEDACESQHLPSVPPQSITEPGHRVERPDFIQNRPPVSLRSRSKLYHYTALVTDVYDGDTLTVDIDMGLNMCAQNQVIRLWKINTPEVRGSEREQGLEVRDFVRDLVLHKYILLRTILDKRGNDKTGKYGRLLGEIILEEENGEVLNLNDYLLAKGLAVPFGKDGSAIRSPAPAGAPRGGLPERGASPQPEGLPPQERQETGRGIELSKGETDCPYCGEVRAVDLENQMVLSCPNCMDGSYWYGEDGGQRLSELG